MTTIELFEALLEREAAISRRALERVPEGRNDWKPHEKSMPLGYLATLVATMPAWIAMAIHQDSLDLAPVDGSGYKAPSWSNNTELLAVHEKAVADGSAALRGTTEAHLATLWQLQVAGKTVLENPRHVVVVDTFTHLAHHRGQLSVYLRLAGAKVPSLYGPSADEAIF